MKLFIWLMMPLMSLGSVAAQDAKPTEAKAEESNSKPWLTKLTAAPAAAPRPSLAIELLPPSRDRHPGNAAIGYLRAAGLRPASPRNPKDAQELDDKVQRWKSAKLADLPFEQLKAHLMPYRQMLKELDHAARCSTCNWQQEELYGPESIAAILPTVQSHREAISILALRAKLELAELRYADAVRTLQTGFQLAKHVGEGSTMIESLVGIALTSIMIGSCEEMIGQPNSPNLYWALTTLPQPFIDPRPSLDGETRFTYGGIADLADLERGPVAEEIANRAMKQLMGQVTPQPAETTGLDAFAGSVGVAGYVALNQSKAKSYLLANGRTAKELDTMPAAQMVLLRTIGLHREVWEDQVKLFSLPYSEAQVEFEKLGPRFTEFRTKHGQDPLLMTFSLVYPALEKVHQAHARTIRRLAQLRAVEAVRLHAAATGQLPANLADVKIVPVPLDPNTGTPFVYSLEGNTFTLDGSPLKPQTRIPKPHVYVVTINFPAAKPREVPKSPEKSAE